VKRFFANSTEDVIRTASFASGGQMSDIFSRVLTPGDARKLREVRLEALQKEGRLFASSYEIESKFPFENWESKCTEDDKHCAIGLFDGTELIGITLVLPYDKDTSGKTGLLGQSYIKREYRGKGLGNLLYSVRIKWVLEKSSFQHAIVYVRDGNDVSTVLNRKTGAQYVETREMMCGDGQMALWHWYKFPLDSASRPVSKTSAPSRSAGLRSQIKLMLLRRAISLWGSGQPGICFSAGRADEFPERGGSRKAAWSGLGGVLSISVLRSSPSQHAKRADHDEQHTCGGKAVGDLTKE